MKINADTLFSKSSNNYMLEEVMDSKSFSDEAKSLILNMVYKIDNAYKDYSKLKFNVKTKEEIITDITNILKNDCDVIKLVATDEFKNSFSVDEDKKTIEVFPSEVPMLQALYYIKKIQRNKKTKSFFNKVLVDAIKKGYALNGAEVIRDFTGWSWTGAIENNKLKLYNIIYQDLLILLGVRNLEEIINSSNVRSHLVNKLAEIYGKNKSDEIIKRLDVCSLLLYEKSSKESKDEIQNYYNSLSNRYKIINNKPEYIAIITRKNNEKMKTVHFIEKALKDKKLLERKYLKPGIKEKYGYLENYRAHLVRLQSKRLKEIEKNTSRISPFEYIRKKEKLAKELSAFDDYRKKITKENPYYNSFLVLQRSVISCLYKKMEISELRKELLGIVYEIRYLKYIQVKDDMLMKDVKELDVDIRNVQRKLISRLYEIKALDLFSNDMNINYEIMKNIFITKSINMNKLYAKLSYKDKKLQIQYFDEDTQDGESIISISNDDFKELVKKTDKKYKLFI